MSDIALAPPDEPTEAQTESFTPAPVASLHEAGVTSSLAEQLVLKNLYFRGEVGGRELARVLGFQFSVIETVVDELKRQRLIEAKRSAGFGNVSSQFALSEEGRARAKEYLETNQFLGPAPVPLKDYVEAVRRQKLKPGWLTKDKLEQAFTGAIVTDEFYSKLGPAVNSFKSLLIYGKPGNGKSFLSEQLARIDSDPIHPLCPGSRGANHQGLRFPLPRKSRRGRREHPDGQRTQVRPALGEMQATVSDDRRRAWDGDARFDVYRRRKDLRRPLPAEGQ